MHMMPLWIVAAKQKMRIELQAVGFLPNINSAPHQAASSDASGSHLIHPRLDAENPVTPEINPIEKIIMKTFLFERTSFFLALATKRRHNAPVTSTPYHHARKDQRRRIRQRKDA
jgi:hypothetical protein